MRDGKKICIVGPGRMGVGIVTAILLANRGHAVTLLDTKARKPGREMAALRKATPDKHAPALVSAGT